MDGAVEPSDGTAVCGVCEVRLCCVGTCVVCGDAERTARSGAVMGRCLGWWCLGCLIGSDMLCREHVQNNKTFSNILLRSFTPEGIIVVF